MTIGRTPGSSRTCPECDAVLSPDSPEGLCPACLLAAGLASAAGKGAEEGDEVVSRSVSPGTPAERGAAKSRHFGDYELIEEIARGGMGAVYRARQLSLNRSVAVKLLLFGEFASDPFVRRFRAEAAAAASLHHPNIVAIHEVGEHQGQHYFSMDLVEGRSLAELVRDTPLPARQAARYVKAIAEAIEYAHRQGVLHRDLKPSNVLVDSSDQPRITDFGLAKRLTGDSDLTMTGQVLGSPNYMPPEQAGREHGVIGPASDVYSLGAILYHLLTGRPPFVAGTLEETLFQLIQKEPVGPRLVNSSVPRDLETICLKCLEKEPAKRYANAQALAEELGRFLNGEPILSRPVGAAEKVWRWCRREPRMAALAAALALALGIGIAGTAWEARRAATEAKLARRAAGNAREQLWHSELARARMARLNIEAGRRAASVQAVQAAAAIRPSIELRNEAAAALALTDLTFLPSIQLPEPNNPLVRYSPSLRLLALRDRRGNVRIHRTGSSQLVRTLKSSHGPALQVQFSPDARLLGVIHGDGTLVVLDWESNAVLFERPPTVRWFAFTPDSEGLLIHDQSRELEFLSLRTLRTHWRRQTGFQLWQLPVSPDGESFALVPSNAREIQLHDLATGEFVITLRHPGAVSVLAWTPDSARIGVGLSTGEIVVWDAANWNMTAQWRAHEDSVRALGFGPGAQWLATMGGDGNCKLWSLPSLQPVVATRGYRVLDQAQFDPDGLRFGYGISNGTAGLFAVQPSEILRRIALPKQEGGRWGDLSFSPDGGVLAISSAEGLSLLDLPGGAELWLDRNGACFTALFSPAGESMFVARSDGLTRLPIERNDPSSRSLRLGRPQVILQTESALQFRRGALSRDGLWLAGAHISHGSVEVFQTANLTNHISLGPHNGVGIVALSSNGQWLASASSAEVKLWSVPTGSLLRTFPQGGPVCFSPNDRWLVMGGEDYCILETATWQERFRLPRRDNSIGCAAFSPPGETVALATERGSIQLLEAGTGRELCRLDAPDGPGLAALAFSPDGRFLAALEFNRGIQLWDLPRLREHLAEMGLDWK